MAPVLSLLVIGGCVDHGWLPALSQSIRIPTKTTHVTLWREHTVTARLSHFSPRTLHSVYSRHHMSEASIYTASDAHIVGKHTARHG
ncbi:hypothetical protein LIA77_08012 [Sarocladium implicatum]|nr:hypothetical protein LIA77_08012 [Sarocladium implicatum]